jgi:hypothetical protein
MRIWSKRIWSKKFRCPRVPLGALESSRHGPCRALVGWIMYPNHELACFSLNFFSRSARLNREIVTFFFALRALHTSFLYTFLRSSGFLIIKFVYFQFFVLGLSYTFSGITCCNNILTFSNKLSEGIAFLLQHDDDTAVVSNKTKKAMERAARCERASHEKN